jgi:dynein heavy chain 1
MRQIDRQLTMYLRRVEDVLGKDWAMHIDGQQLKTEGDNFRRKLDTQRIVDAWLETVQTRRNENEFSRLFNIEQKRGGKDGKTMMLSLSVNFRLVNLLNRLINNT